MLQAIQAIASATSGVFQAGGDAYSAFKDLRKAHQTAPPISGQSGAVGGFGMVAGKATEALKAFSGPAGQVVDAFKQIYDTGVQIADQQLEANRNLQKFSAGIHRAYVDLELTRMENQQKLAAATESSASALADAQRSQEEQLLAGETGMADWNNKIGSFFKNMQTGFKSLWYEVTGAAKHGRDLLKQTANAKTPAQQALDALEQMARGELADRRRRKPIEMPKR